jgi:L-aminopeptidase/D-esterase-like protein
MFDGDTVFCLGTGKKALPETTAISPELHAEALSAVGHHAADCLARAIIHAVIGAESMGNITAFRDLENYKPQ